MILTVALTCEYEGKTYYRNNAKWVDGDSLAVPAFLQHILNTLALGKEDISGLSYEDAKREGDKLKASESYELAVKYYEQAIRMTDSQARVSSVLPRMTSCYRKLSKPAKVIELLSDVKVAFGEGIINEALLTSAAAAYCDLGEPENAIRCCRWGYRVLRSKTEEYSDELSNVFARAKKMIDPSYSVREALDEKDMEDELRNNEALY